jgi:hypothetical protein
VNIVGLGVSGRETIVTLAACVLLVFEAVPGIVLGLSILTGIGGPSYPLYVALALIGGGVLSLVLIRQGASPCPPATRGGRPEGRSPAS